MSHKKSLENLRKKSVKELEKLLTVLMSSFYKNKMTSYIIQIGQIINEKTEEEPQEEPYR